MKWKLTKKVGINGFGRIGKLFFRAALMQNADIDFVGINDLTDTKTLAHLLKYDSCYGRYQKRLDFTSNSIVVAGKKYRILAEKDPDQLPWQELGVDIVLECTGRFRTKEDASKHIKGTRDVFFEESGGFVSTAIYDGDAMQYGNLITGPAIVEQKITTIVVPPGYNLEVEKYGDFMMEVPE